MIPDFQSLMRPALDQLADGDVHTTRQIREALAVLPPLLGRDQVGRSTGCTSV